MSKFDAGIHWGYDTPRDNLVAEVQRLEDENARLQAHRGEAWQEYRRLWLRWFEERTEKRYLRRRLRRTEGESDGYKALAEQRGRAGVFLWWYIGQSSGVDSGDTVRSYGVAAYAALTTPEIKNT